MGGVADEIQAGLEELASETPEHRSSVRAESVTVKPSDREPVITPVTILDPSPTAISASAIQAEAMLHQSKSDSLKLLAMEARSKVNESEDPNDRWVWQKQIILWEKKSKDQQEMADELLSLLAAHEARQRLSGRNVPGTIEPDTVLNGITVFRYTSSSTVPGEPGTPPVQKETELNPDQKINRFQILDQSPYPSPQSIPMDVPVPSGAFYRIQLGVFSTEVNSDVFKGITPITGERMVDRGMVKYYAGKFSRYADAADALEKIQAAGFGDAFIVAWYNGKQVATHQAKQLE
jgi:hypothetical protein